MIPKKPQLVEFGAFRAASPNGVNRVIYGLSNLASADFKVHVTTLTDHAAVKELQESISVHHFSAAQFGGFKLPREYLAWLGQVNSPIIFHLHSVFDPRNFSLAQVLVRRSIPYVFTPHDSYSPNSLRHRYLTKHIYLRTFERYVLEHAAVIHALTNQGARDITLHTTNRRIMTIRNFVSELPAQQPAPRRQRNRLVYVGRLDIFQKGIDRLIELLRDGALSRFELELDVVGPGDTRAVRQLVKRARLNEDKVRIHGGVTEERKVELLQSAGLYVQASRFEGFGLSIAEALSLSLPVVISREIPIHREIELRGAGRCFSTIDEGVRCLTMCLEMSIGAYRDMTAAARLTFEQCFSTEGVRRDYLEMFHAALNRAQTDCQA